MRTSSTGSPRNRTSNSRLFVQFEPSMLDAASYEGFDAQDLFTALPPRYREAGRPVFVYLHSDLPEHSAETAALDQAFFSEKISIAMKMFSPIKVDGQKIGANHPYASILAGEELPRLVLVGSDGRKIASVEGRVSEAKVLGLMKKAAERSFKTSLDRFVDSYQDLLDQLDRIDLRKDEIAKERAEVTKSTPALDKRWAKEDAELAKLEQEVKDLESRLLEFKRKVDPKGRVAAG